MSLVRLTDATLGFGDVPVLDKLSVSIDGGERIALVGRNGAGKSTLLKVIAGMQPVDSGELTTGKNVRVAYLEQSVPQDLSGTVFTSVASGLADSGDRLLRLQRLNEELANCDDKAQLAILSERLTRLHEQLDTNADWGLQARVDEILSRMSLPAEKSVSELSGGLKRRVLLARALLQDPQVLLLDEPTNHLDIASVQWLENYLKGLRCTLVFVTHDRAFLRTLATRILDIDRGSVSDWPGNYDKYLLEKEKQLQEQSRHDALFDKKLAEEEIWIRQGIKARRTRNEGRVRQLKKLREERSRRREQPGVAKISANLAERSGKKVITAEKISFKYPATENQNQTDNAIFRDFSCGITRGDKIAIIGPNGIGKSTLIKVLLGELPPTEGTIEHGTNLQIAYFDQLRSTLRTDLSAQDNVSGGKDMINFQGADRHIISYMKEFLFSPERARAPIKALSGGETSRLMLAKLFLQQSNVLVMDEPTNDLDVETLELLETLLANYEGSVILISHDRHFIDNVVTSTIIFKEDGKLDEFIGGYSDWNEKHGKEYFAEANTEQSTAIASDKNINTNSTLIESEKTSDQNAAKKETKKLSYKLQRELDQLPDKISSLEKELVRLEKIINSPDFFTKNSQSDTQRENILEQVKNANLDLEAAYARWDELENQTTG